MTALISATVIWVVGSLRSWGDDRNDPIPHHKDAWVVHPHRVNQVAIRRRIHQIRVDLVPCYGRVIKVVLEHEQRHDGSQVVGAVGVGHVGHRRKAWHVDATTGAWWTLGLGWCVGARRRAHFLGIFVEIAMPKALVMLTELPSVEVDRSGLGRLAIATATRSTF